MSKIVIVLDSKEGHVTHVFTEDPTLEVEVVDIDIEADDPVWGPHDTGVTVVVTDVDAAAMEQIKIQVPDYQPEEKKETSELDQFLIDAGSDILHHPLFWP